MKSLPVIILPKAQADLRAIANYIAERSPMNAEKFMNRMEAEILALGEYGSGVALAPEAKYVAVPLRQVVVYPYRVLFRADQGKIEVVHVRHGNRLPARKQELGGLN